MIQWQIIVEGRVQGVGYRAFAQRAAKNLSLTGEVFNREDGTVAMIACHADPGHLVDFVNRLPTGPGYVSRISHYEVWGHEYSSFDITTSH